MIDDILVILDLSNYVCNSRCEGLFIVASQAKYTMGKLIKYSSEYCKLEREVPIVGYTTNVVVSIVSIRYLHLYYANIVM